MNMDRIALAGFGSIGQVHLSALKALGREVNLLVGRDEERTRLFAEANGIPSWTVDIKDLPKHRIEVLHVCTPPAHHFDLVKFALENGIHVICEKPLTLDVKSGELLAGLAESRKLISAVNFNVRRHASCLKLKEMVGQGMIGDVLLVNGSYMQQYHALPCRYSWRYEDRSLATTEIGSHWIDLLTFITGRKVKAVSATYGSFMQDRTLKGGIQYRPGGVEGEPLRTETDNVAIITLRLEGDSLASVVLSEITQGRGNYLELTITGTEGSLWWNSDDLNDIHMGRKGETPGILHQPEKDGFEESIIDLLREVYKDIGNGRESENHAYATFNDGLENIRVCDAIYKGAHNRSDWVWL